MTKRRKPSEYEQLVNLLDKGMFCTNCKRYHKTLTTLNNGLWTNVNFSAENCPIKLLFVGHTKIVKRAINYATN